MAVVTPKIFLNSFRILQDLEMYECVIFIHLKVSCLLFCFKTETIYLIQVHSLNLYYNYFRQKSSRESKTM